MRIFIAACGVLCLAFQDVTPAEECRVETNGVAVIQTNLRRTQEATLPVKNVGKGECELVFGIFFVGDEPERGRLNSSFIGETKDGMLAVSIKDLAANATGRISPGGVVIVEVSWTPDETFIPVVSPGGETVPPEPSPYTVELMWKTASQ